MGDNPARRARTLMDVTTYEENFGEHWEKKTYLCYEVEVWKGDAWVPAEELPDVMHNQGLHAELRFLDRVRSWPLDRGNRYRLTCYISWSPCPDCVPELVAFLGQNSHVSLRIYAARIYTQLGGYEHGLRLLRDNGAELAIMTCQEHQDCWEQFVDHQGQPFNLRPEVDVNIAAQCQKLKDILGNREN